jgi:choice-of-anchor B domain-containing protein
MDFPVKIFRLFVLILFCLLQLFSQSSLNMRKLADINNHSSDGFYSACWGYKAPDGREYGILGCWKGTAFIDITDTNNIHEVDYVPSLGSCCREMKTFSHYAYVVGDGVPTGLQIIDLQYLPDSVSLVNTFYFPGFTMGHTISQEGPYLYINAGNYQIGGTFILDITDPVHPVKRGEWETQVVHDCRVRNDTIWACNIYNPPGTISVIDARDKDNPVRIAMWENIPNPGPHNIALSNDRKFAFVTDEINGNPRLLKIWNVSNLQNVTFCASWQPTGITTSIIHNVELHGKYLFASHYTAGLRVVDVSDPYNPAEKAYYDTYPLNDGFTYDGCWGNYIFSSEKIICSDRSTGLYVLKTSFQLDSIHVITEPVPYTFYLNQNYPNPFNPVTTIDFGMQSEGYVQIKIYDASGKQAAVLFDSYTEAGNHRVTFEGKNLSSGVYFCVMQSGTFKASKKMVFVK